MFYAVADEQVEGVLARIAMLGGDANAPAKQPSVTETPAPGVANFARMF